LGGLNGVNDLARCIAEVLDTQAAITTTGDIRFRTALLSPPPGYHLANPDDAKKFISDLLAGEQVKLEGTAPWLSNSQLPIDPNGNLTIQVTERCVTPTANCLVYHPKNVAIAITHPDVTLDSVQTLLANADIASAAIAGIFAPITIAAYANIRTIADFYGVPMRFSVKS
jgi:cobalt-precorrin 5A hydrolase/precorrin-3B C17-methyltransferase